MSECGRIVGIPVMEVGHGGVRGRPVEASTTDASKRRRIASRELRTSPSSNVESRSNCCFVNSPPDSSSPVQSENSVELVLGDLCASSCADHTPVSLCSSNETGEVVRNSLRSADLEVIREFRIWHFFFLSPSFAKKLEENKINKRETLVALDLAE